MGAHAPFLSRILLTLIALVVAPSVIPGADVVLQSTARAQDKPYIQLLSGGDVVGDGVTPVTLNIVALNIDRTSMQSGSFKIVAKGQVGKVNLVRPGLFAAQWTPPRVAATTDMVVGVRGKSQDKVNVSHDWNISVHPPLGQQVKITTNPARLTLGHDAGATISIQLSGGANQNLKNVDLMVKPSSGTVSNLTHLGGGKFVASYKPPKKFSPHLALITVADRRTPGRTYGSIAIPLIGKALFPVVGQPNGTVLVRIDDREFGPAQTDAKGKAQVPIEVHPGYQSATLISVVQDRRIEENLDLKIPPGSRVSLFPIQETIPADQGLKVPVRAYVTRQDGAPDPGATVTFQTTAGKVSKAVHEGNGIYKADLTPPFGTTATTATLQVEVEDLSGVTQADSVDLKLIPARPGEVQVTPEPSKLSKDAAAFQVMAKILAADGVGMPGRSLSFTVTGANPSGETIDLGSGDYQARFKTTGTGAVELIATARAVATGNPLHRVLMFPSRDRMSPDGLSSTMLTVLTLDEFGYPVANVPVELKLIKGVGTLPAKTTTDSAGLAQVHLTAGRKPGVALIQAKARGYSTSIPILLAPMQYKGNNVAQGYALPVSGSAQSIALFEAWRKIIRSHRLEREGMEGAPVQGIIGAPTVGPITSITATADPTSVAAGGTVTILISATDSKGRGVGGRPITVTASQLGRVGAVTDLGGGKYKVQVTVPAGTAGKVTVGMNATGVNVGKTVDIPITGGTWKSVGDVSQVTQQPAPVAPQPVRKPRDGPPIVRASSGLTVGGYSYKQEAVIASGPLYDYDITFGGGVTSPATSPGFTLAARAWLPGDSMKYLGFAASFRSVNYSLSLKEFDTPIVDWLNEFSLKGVARYPHDIGDVRIHGGVGVGMTMDDFMIYKQDGNQDVRVLEYMPLVIPGMVIGPEVGVDWKGKLFLDTSLNFGLANAATYYKITWNGTVGYAFVPNWYVFLGGEISNRETGVWIKPKGGGKKAQVGILADHLNAGTLGVGFQY